MLEDSLDEPYKPLNNFEKLVFGVMGGGFLTLGVYGLAHAASALTNSPAIKEFVDTSAPYLLNEGLLFILAGWAGGQALHPSTGLEAKYMHKNAAVELDAIRKEYRCLPK